jgi:GT2 family glycosyltransferase
VARVRVVLGTYNQVPHLRRSLRGWLRQTTADFTLAVADDGSTDETRRLVEAFAKEAAARGIAVEHHWQEDLGFRKARSLNAAIRAHRGEDLILFSDGDCIPPERFVERHLAVHGPRSFHVGGAVRLSREASERLTEADVDAGRHEALATPADLRDLRRRARKSRWGTFLRRKNRPKVLGLNMAFDRALLEDVNGFDETFEGWGLEDSDLRDRVMRARPRARVRVLYGTNDVVHLWHPVRDGEISRNRAYYETPRPWRCVRGLVRPVT